MLTKTLENLTIYTEKPANFSPACEVAACYVRVGKKVLVLQRAEDDTEGGLWGMPAGKIEAGETPEEGARRELLEETGIDLADSSALENYGTLYARKPSKDFTYHLFRIHCPVILPTVLSSEHQDFRWVELDDVFDLDLMAGGADSFHYFIQTEKKNSWAKANIAAYLILRRGNEVLLQLRQNTGFQDGRYSLVSGHVEPGETVIDGLIREAKEEAGIDLDPASLKVVHVEHRQNDRWYVCIFFESSEWSGDIVNMEPNKCAGLDFFPEDQLPANTADHIRKVLQLTSNDVFFSELVRDRN